MGQWINIGRCWFRCRVVCCVVLYDRIRSGIRIGAGSEHIQYRPFEFDFDFYVDIDVGVDVGDNG